MVVGERRDRVVMVMGDLNSRVGPKRDGEAGVVGRWAAGERNENGRRLVGFAGSQGLWVASTGFQNRRAKRVTWVGPGRRVKQGAQLDYVLVQRRWGSAVRDVEAKWAREVGSDHADAGGEGGSQIQDWKAEGGGRTGVGCWVGALSGGAEGGSAESLR